MELRFGELTAALPQVQVEGDASIPVRAVTCDSRRVQPGSLFVAYRGVALDGHDYIRQALERGAVALVAEREPPEAAGQVPVALVPNGREALAYLSAAWHGFPSRKLTVVGVTGTDGKTTTCNLLHNMLVAAGRRAGLITTIRAVLGGRVLDTGLHTTTPDAPDLQRYLAEMVDSGMEIAVLEATSEGLAQHRVAACDFDVAVVTNITHEHLYFHGSLESYQQAKAMLFYHLSAGHRKPGSPKVAILNADDDSYRYLSPIPADLRLAYSIVDPAASGARGTAEANGQDSGSPAFRVLATGVHRSAAGTRFVVQMHPPAQPLPAMRSIPDDLPVVADFELRTALIGHYNVSNILAAASAALVLGTPIEAIQQGAWQTRGVVGRMEPIDEGQDFAALVDFAHTPNALKHALETARAMTRGRVIAVFGCAGERDVQKRAWMGEISARLADVSIFTAEDPRRESLDAILAEMAQGAEATGATEGERYYCVPDRAEAIQFAVDLARAGDLVITCGKGHEQSMCYGTVETPWNEHEALRAALRQRRGQAEHGD